MIRNQKPTIVPVPAQSHDAVRNLGSMTRRLGLNSSLAASPAIWPSGVSLLAQMVDACQRCDAAEFWTDWLARAPDSIVVPPAFCPNANALMQAKKRALK